MKTFERSATDRSPIKRFETSIHWALGSNYFGACRLQYRRLPNAIQGVEKVCKYRSYWKQKDLINQTTQNISTANRITRKVNGNTEINHFSAKDHLKKPITSGCRINVHKHFTRNKKHDTNRNQNFNYPPIKPSHK